MRYAAAITATMTIIAMTQPLLKKLSLLMEFHREGEHDDEYEQYDDYVAAESCDPNYEVHRFTLY